MSDNQFLEKNGLDALVEETRVRLSLLQKGVPGGVASLDENGNVPSSQLSGTGHKIKDESATNFAQRENLKFINAEVSDDSANDTSVVLIKGDNIVCDTATWNSMSDAEKAKFRTVDLTDDLSNIGVDSAPTANSSNAVLSGGVYTALADKVDKVTGKGLSTEDYTTAEKTKLDGIETGAQVNVKEGYLNSLDGKFYEESTYETEILAESGKIYVDKSTNKAYRWSGSAYVSIRIDLELGDNSDVSLTYPADGDILQYDDTNEEWVNVPNSLGNITNVYLTNLQNGDRIKYDSQSDSWINGPGAKSDWNESDSTDDSYILNKPTLGSAAAVNTTSAVTQNSTDAFTSGGAYTALAGKADTATTLSGYGITNAYTKTEVDEMISELVEGMTWKPAVTTYNDIATTYPNPQEGWTVCCTDTNIVWRYSGAQWVKISANTIPLASSSVDGLMTSSDFSKLSNLPSGAEVNQNAFSNVKVGSTTVAADSKTDTLELVGSNVTLTPDATNDKVTIGITKANVTTALGYTPPTSDTNTHRKIQVNGTEILGDNTTVLNLKAGSNVSLSNSSGTVTIAATNTNTHRPIQMNGSQILGDNTTALNLKAGTNVSLSNSNGTVTITSTDTNTWRGIQNNLTSTSTSDSLSAYQGKLLNDYIKNDSWGNLTRNTSYIHATNGYLQYQKVGRLVILNLEFEWKTTAAISTWTTYQIASGAPASYFGFPGRGTLIDQAQNLGYPFYVDANGRVYMEVKGVCFTASWDVWLRGQFVYFASA